jgi:hypothetical protein
LTTHMIRWPRYFQPSRGAMISFSTEALPRYSSGEHRLA